MKSIVDGPCGRSFQPLFPPQRRSGRVMPAIAMLAMQLAAVQPLLVWHGPVAAQDSGDCGEGSNPDPNVDPTDSPEPRPDPAVQDPQDSEDEEDDPTDLGEEGDGVDTSEDSSVDGGDSMDGGGTPGDSAGTDGDGGESASYSPSSYSSGGFGSSSSSESTSESSDPIDMRLADKRHVQVDYVARGAAALRMARVYHSNAAVNTARVKVPMGAGWHMFYDRSLQALSSTSVRLHRANGRTVDFTLAAGKWASALPAGVLTSISGGWQYLNNRDTLETYDANGRLLRLGSGGLVTTLQYETTGRLASVTNPFGRSLSFAYDSSSRLSGVTLPGGGSLAYGYDARGNLVSIRFADGATRKYVYENTSFPHALTGVIDESGRRRVTWGYDAQGRPNLGYYGNSINTVRVVYGTDSVTTTDARGTQRTRTFTTAGPRRVLTSLQTAATADSATTRWTFAHDANGNPATVVSRTGETRRIQADSRGRMLSGTRAAGTSQAMDFQTVWHDRYRKPLQTVARGVVRNFTIDSVGRITKIIRTAGGNTDTVLTRTYNAQGLVQSVTNARGATTTYTYDAAGNRTSTTDALGQTVYFKNHSADGRPTRIERPDGIVITRSFDTRGRLVSRTVAGLTTGFAYDGAGRVTRVTRPDGSWDGYTYDSAGLAIRIDNHRGESTVLGRDVTGKIVDRKMYAANGALASASSRQFNALGRLATEADSRGYATRLVYAADGRPAGVTDPLGLTRTFKFDLIDRPISATQANTAAMRQATGQATTTSRVVYAAGTGNKLSVTDTNAVGTGYSYNAVNRKVGEAGNDAGGRSTMRNAAHDVVSTTDARGNTFTLNVDPLGRVAALTPSTGTGITCTYVSGRRDGLLAHMTDTSGATIWTHDAAGRVLAKQHTGTVARAVSITRDTLGRPRTIVYPSGLSLGIVYSGDLVTSLTLNGGTLLSKIAYRPGGRVATDWTWGNGTTYSRGFDTDGRVERVTLGSSVRQYAHDEGGRVVGFTDQGPQGTKNSTFAYDEAGHLTGYTGPAGQSQSFAYDTNGNRRSEVTNGVARSYSYQASSNRLLSLTGLRNYTYNADGSVVSDGKGMTFGYDSYGRMVTATGPDYALQFRYNGLGQRVSKTVWDIGAAVHSAPPPDAGVDIIQDPEPNPKPLLISSRQFFYDDAGQLLGEYDSRTGYSQETVWFNGQPVATVQAGVVYYIQADNVGTPRSITRSTDRVEVWRWDSDPFGTSRPTHATGSPLRYNLRFPGQYFDEETGLHSNGYRDYDPLMGRYVQVDPLGLTSGPSRYAYAGGDPISMVDPLGLQGVPGVLISVTTNIGLQLLSNGGQIKDINLQEVALAGLTGAVLPGAASAVRGWVTSGITDDIVAFGGGAVVRGLGSENADPNYTVGNLVPWSLSLDRVSDYIDSLLGSTDTSGPYATGPGIIKKLFSSDTKTNNGTCR